MGRRKKIEDDDGILSHVRPETKRAVLAVLLAVFGIIIVLSSFGAAGRAGDFLYDKILHSLFGFGAVMVPVLSFVFAILLVRPIRMAINWYEGVSAGVLFLAILGILHILAGENVGGGWVGKIIGGAMVSAFDMVAGIILLFALAIAGFLVLFNEELRMPEFLKNLMDRIRGEHHGEKELRIHGGESDDEESEEESDSEEESSDASEKEESAPEEKPAILESEEEAFDRATRKRQQLRSTYVPPPLSLLEKSSGKPTVGDIKANAGLIKRTLENFGMAVEMDEVSIGPTVTRYALKPAEGVKLSRIVALRQDLSLALAAHPLRIEAPIPGKSLVGIELPNRTKSTVGLGSMLEESIFKDHPKRLAVALGKNVTGKSCFSDIAKMPHLLVAGTTGSGKSVVVHNLILSLLYRNGPDQLRFIMVDPKRVELTLYNNIPHLLTPVIKDAKKTILALRWAAKEMERRYDILEKNSCRDVGSYHKNIVEPFFATHSDEELSGEGVEVPDRMPYIVIIIDELADIMQAYPRELEAGIVRLAQMSRATGIHLILSTQRPSVNVITGLIKANVPARVALQVASQIDSRTILDASGAETLLGAGDMLFQGADMAKPERMQSAFVTEEEVKAVVSFIKKHNETNIEDGFDIGDIHGENAEGVAMGNDFGDNSDDDELYGEARRIVIEAGKASTSYIQRKLKVGYSRAARLLDLLEERGVVGPADGSKPREVLGGSSPEQQNTV